MRIACVIAYNEERMLPGCLESVHGQVDRIVVVDGRYEQFPAMSDRERRDGSSTDATIDVALAFGAAVIPPPGRPWRSQMEKRSAYLVGHDGDRYLRIDADERLVGSLDGLQAGINYSMRVVWAEGMLQPWVPCLFEHRGRMCYEGAHCALWSDGQIISRRADCEQWTGAHLVHLTEHRPAERQRAKQRYYAWQRASEREFREGNDV